MADATVRTFYKVFKYRIYPTKDQVAIFETWLGLCCELYNAALEERREAWRLHGKNLSYQDQTDQLPEIKEIREDLKIVKAQVLQNVLKRVKHGYDKFFETLKRGEKAGLPRFKPRRRYNSFTLPQLYPHHVGKKHLFVYEKTGLVRIKIHRPLEGKPKTCTIKRTPRGHWYATVTCENVPGRLGKPTGNEVGIDVGIENFATLSTGERIENPRLYRKAEARLALAKSKADKNKSKKHRREFSRLYEKVMNQRKDFQHKLSRRIVSENDFIAVEDLDVAEMQESGTKIGISKSLTDASCGRFLDFVSYKAEEAGRAFVRVNPRGTSSTCFNCGKVKKKELSERLHSCPCGYKAHRDVNAAKNILRAGRALQGNES